MVEDSGGIADGEEGLQVLVPFLEDQRGRRGGGGDVEPGAVADGEGRVGRGEDEVDSWW